jgi:hypothetical protein
VVGWWGVKGRRAVQQQQAVSGGGRVWGKVWPHSLLIGRPKLTIIRIQIHRYLDGQLLNRQNSNPEFVTPSKPMYFLASIWSDAPRGFQFGGKLDYTKSPFFSTISNLMQIVCEGGLGYNGPNWLYEPTPILDDEPAAEEAAAPVDEAPPPPDAEPVADADAAAAEEASVADTDAAPPVGEAAPPPEDAAAAPEAEAGPAPGEYAELAVEDPSQQEFAVEEAAPPPDDAASVEEEEPTSEPEANAPEAEMVPVEFEAEPPPPEDAESVEVVGGEDADAAPPPEAEAASDESGAAGSEPEVAPVNADEQFVLESAPGDSPGAAAAAPLDAQPAASDPLVPHAAHGAYLGCFNAVALNLKFDEGLSLSTETAVKCADHCEGRKLPVYALNRALTCVCSSAVPEPSARVADSACERLPATAGGASLQSAVAVYYLADDAGAQSCAAARSKLSVGNYQPMYNPNNAAYEGGAADSLEMKMQGADGVRISGKDAMTYGMFSFKARVSDASGVITAAYMRSDKHETADKQFEEIGGFWGLGF